MPERFFFFLVQQELTFINYSKYTHCSLLGKNYNFDFIPENFSQIFNFAQFV